MIYTDQVRITPRTIDKWGAETIGTPVLVKARFEENDKIKYGADGKPIQFNFFTFLPPGTDVAKIYFIEPTKRKGVVISSPPKYEVKEANLEGGYRASHWEVFA